VVDGQALASQNRVISLALVRGIRRADLAKLTIVSRTLTEGALDHFNADSVIIGAGLANRMGLVVGDTITLFQPYGTATAFGTVPNSKLYTVGGTFKIGNTVDDNTVVFMPLEEAQAFFNTGEGVNSIELTVSDPDRDIQMLPDIARAAGPNVQLVTWQDLNGAFMDAVNVERDVMFLILLLIIVVAALNIVSGLTMLVKDKSADIAILRTMGASRGAVMRVFIIAGMSIGITGTLLGLLLGVAFCWNIEEIRQGLQHLTGTTLFDPTIYFLSRIPADLDPVQAGFIVTMALALSFLATLYPSWRAARLDPVEALRYE
jgi:lipoprotein-releasing system permease protein